MLCLQPEKIKCPVQAHVGEDDSMDFAKKEVRRSRPFQHAAEACARQHFRHLWLSANVGPSVDPLVVWPGHMMYLCHTEGYVPYSFLQLSPAVQ